MSNRRRSRRVPFRTRVRYGLNNPSLLGYLSNISENGIKIEGKKVFPPGTKLVI
ncbi:MAG: PilZ domain-containing protein [Deltaproteobacteria bacterium]|nr:PilZ domain-containing protein [Deltaproteobacteria bacterium]